MPVAELVRRAIGRLEAEEGGGLPFVVLKELRISEALTADRYRELVGIGFRKLF